MRKYCSNALFVVMVCLLSLSLNNCVENIDLNAPSSNPSRNNNQEKHEEDRAMVECSMIPEKERQEAFLISGGDYGIAGSQRLLDGSSFQLMKLVDLPVWSELSPWLEAQKNKKNLAQRLKEWPGVQDMIRKSDVQLARALWCLSEEMVQKIKNSTDAGQVEYGKKLDISCKDALNAANGFDRTAFPSCRKEYMSLYLDLLALEKAQ